MAIVLLILADLPLSAQPGFVPPIPVQPPMPQAAPLPMQAQPYANFDAQIAAEQTRAQEAEEAQGRLEREIEDLRGRRDATAEDLRRRTRALYRMRRAGMLPVAGGFHALLGHLSRVERVERMVRSDLGALRFLRNRRDALRSELVRRQEEVASARSTIAQLEQQKVQQQRQYQVQQMYAGVFDPSYAPRLPVTAPAAPAPVAPAPVAPAVPSYGLTLRNTQPTRGFAALQGRLRLPVAGGAVREAQREDGRGLEFISPGAAVVASADGRVAFSERYGAYGRLVILDHGDNYYTLYGGLSDSSLVRGEWIGQGARIGTVGSSPLFFAVRQGTRSLNARSWVGL
ncbi:MAG: M23 family metallopeptidase [Myxococcota bacterium]